MRDLSLVILLLAGLSIGCRLPGFLQGSDANGTANSGSTTSGRVKNPETAPTGDARADVIRASKKFLDLPKFSAKMDGTGKSEMHIDLEYQAPDRFHMRYRDSGGQVQNEMILIGRASYIKFGPSWQRIPGAEGQRAPDLRALFDEKGLESLTNVSYVGEDTVNGQQAYIYSYRNEEKKAGATYPFTSRIWVSATDGLPQKIQVDYEGGDLKTLTILYDHTKEVTIEPPVSGK